MAPLKATTVLSRNIPCKCLSLSGPSDNIEIPFDVVRRTTSPADIWIVGSLIDVERRGRGKRCLHVGLTHAKCYIR